MTSKLTIERPFALYHAYSDGTGKPEFIYIGIDKSKALDELMKFDGYFDSNSLHIEYQSEYSKTNKPK